MTRLTVKQIEKWLAKQPRDDHMAYKIAQVAKVAIVFIKARKAARR